MKIYESIESLIGTTPLLKMKRTPGAENAEILLKLEYFNPCSSIKDRIARNMIDVAEASGKLSPGGTIVEPTSGNTGIGLAMIAAVRGYKLIIVMPDNMSRERMLLMRHFGTELVLTPGAEGMAGAIAKANEIVKETGAFLPDQFNNLANAATHEFSTAAEIWNDTEGTVAAFVAGVGTGGTLCGTGKGLKSHNPAIRIVAVEPMTSAVLSGEKAGPHEIQGIGAGFIPGNCDTKLIDEVMKISDRDALETAKVLAKQEGVLCGISSGANVFAALELAKRPEFAGKKIVTVVCDTGERYLSTPLFQ